MNQHVSLNGSIETQIFSLKTSVSKPWQEIQPPRWCFRGGISWSFVNTWASTCLQNTRFLATKTPKFCEAFVKQNGVFFHQVGLFFAKNDVLIGTRTCFDGLMSWYICMMGLSLGLGVDGWGWYHISVMSNSQVLICVQCTVFNTSLGCGQREVLCFWTSQI